MKTFIVKSADLITKAGIEPFVGLTVVINGKEEQIARTCKQAVLDLHKSARGANIPAGLFDNGVASANPLMLNQFRNAIIGLINKSGFADVEFHEAGEKYIATEESTAVKNGEAQVGDTLLTTKKGSRVEGFLTFPLTDLEQAQRNYMESADPLVVMQALFGIAPAPVVAEIPKQLPDPKEGQGENEDPKDKIEHEVFGKKDETFVDPEDETKDPIVEPKANGKAKV